jgi:drug/metabolite transporter (DMT)-like permease
MVASVSVRVAAASFAVGAVVLLVVWLTDLSFERAALLAPVLVVGVAAVAGLLVLWGRVGWAHFRESRHPRLILGAAVAILAVGLTLTLLGVKLPHE